MADRPAAHLTDDTLNEYLDEALSPGDAAQVQAHLATCTGCAARLASLRVLFASLDALPPATLARDLAPAVTQAVRQARPRPSVAPRHPLYRLIFPVQALVAAGLLALAWPFVSGQAAALGDLTLAALALVNNSLDPSQRAADIAAAAGQLWPALRGAAQSAWAAFSTSTLPGVPMQPLLVTAAAAGALWLTTHVWLLRPTRRSPIRRH